MISLQIADIYLKIDEQSFETELQNYQDTYSSATMTHQCNQLRMQKSGQEMLQVVIENDNGSKFMIVGERDDVTGEITFKPVKIRSMNKTFFSTIYSDPDDVGQPQDPSMFFRYFMENLCKKNKGTFSYLDASGDMKIIKDGNEKKVESIALADENGNIYSTAGAKSVGAVYEDEGKKFKIKKFWKEWLTENPDVEEKVNQQNTATDKFNFMGKALIAKKLNGDIDFDEFQDVFIQICSYDMVTDKTVLNFYQILK